MADTKTELQDFETQIELQGHTDRNITHSGIFCQDQEEWPGVSMRLVNEISKRAASVYDLPKLIDDIVNMTEKTVRASASSILLLDEEKNELYFEVVRGDAQDTLKQLRINAKTGIAGWVIQNGKPLIVNDVSNDLRFNKGIDKTTGFVTKSILCIPLIVHRKIIGVIEVLNKIDGSEFNNGDLETLLPVASFAAIAIENTKLQQSVLDGYKSTIKALAAAVDAKDPYTCGHSHRVMGWALTAGIAIGLSDKELAILEYGAILHDIGKIGIDDRIIRKPGPLDPNELIIIREHPAIGAKMIEDIPFLAEAKRLILCHHERYDGTGYPHGLSRDEIPLSAQIVAIADTFDTMTTDRSYRAALSIPYTLRELRRCAGTQFCTSVVDAFVSGFQEYYAQ